jgi:hypothetical protein
MEFIGTTTASSPSLLSSVRDPWHSGSGSPDPYLWLMDPTPFFINFKDDKEKYFFQIFSHNLPTGTSSSLFQSAQHIYEKREGSGSVPLNIGSWSGFRRLKNMRIRILNIASQDLFITLAASVSTPRIQGAHRVSIGLAGHGQCRIIPWPTVLHWPCWQQPTSSGFPHSLSFQKRRRNLHRGPSQE